MQLSKTKRRFERVDLRRKMLKYQSLGIIIQNRQIDAMSKLQKTIDKQIKQIVPQPTVSVSSQLQIKNQKNKLFQFFKEKSREVEGKLEQQKINAYSQIIYNIMETVKHRQKSKTMKLNKINKQLQQLYQNGHEIYNKLVLRKSEELENERELIKEKTLKKEKDKQGLQLQLSVLREQKIVFLRIMLKNGYYMSNGIEYFFDKMIETNYEPSYMDFPDILDDKTIQCLMIQYDNLRKQKQMKKLPNIKKRVVASSCQKEVGFQKIAVNKRVKSVYDETKTYISDWLKKQGWKNRSLKTITPENNNPKNEQWKYKQAKRMKQVYDKVTYRKVMRIAFGITSYQRKKLKRNSLSSLKK